VDRAPADGWREAGSFEGYGVAGAGFLHLSSLLPSLLMAVSVSRMKTQLRRRLILANADKF
jgi:hypothetical protein